MEDEFDGDIGKVIASQLLDGECRPWSVTP